MRGTAYRVALVSAAALLVGAPAASHADVTLEQLREKLEKQGEQLERQDRELREQREHIEALEEREEQREAQAEADGTEIDDDLAASIQRVADRLDKVQIGVQVRTRTEYRHDFRKPGSGRAGPGDGGFGSGAISLDDADQSFTFLRSRVWIDVQPVEEVRAFVQLQDSRIFGGSGAANDTEGVDLKQGFLEIRNVADLPFWVRGGRQAIALGDQRLVGAFEWDNVGRSFDGGRLHIGDEDLSLSSWVAVIAELGDQDDEDQHFTGAYGHARLSDALEIEPYFMVLDGGEFMGPETGGGGDRTVFTAGGRVHGVIAEIFDYEVDGAGQWGEIGSDSIQDAWFIHASAGVTAPVAGKPRLAYAYNRGSGDDDPTDGEISTFTNLFPTNHKFYGYLDFFSLQNLENHRITASVRPCDGLKIQLDWHWFRLTEAEDAWYRASRMPVARDPSGSSSRDAGQEVDVTVGYTFNEYLKLQLGYSHFLTGTFQRKAAQQGLGTGTNATDFEDVDWVYLQALISI